MSATPEEDEDLLEGQSVFNGPRFLSRLIYNIGSDDTDAEAEE